MNERTAPGAAVMGLVGAGIGLVLMAQALAAVGWDASVFLNIGESSPEVRALAERYLGSVVLLPQLGHDGRFFFVQAIDPWIEDPGSYRAMLDFPAYRARRLAYPALVGVFGLLPVKAIPWMMALVNVAGLGLGSWATSRLALRLGCPAWLGLAFVANPGMFNEFFVSGAGIVALALALWGIDAVDRGRWWVAGSVLTGAVLAREVMLLTVVGLAVNAWRARRRGWWRVAALPVIVWGGWAAWVWARLGVDTSGARAALGWPFIGIAAAVRGWASAPGIEIGMASVLAAASVVVVVSAVRTRNLVAWGTVGFALLAPFLSRLVWQQSFDMSRALAPVFTAAVLLVGSWASTNRAPKRRPTQDRPGPVEDMA